MAFSSWISNDKSNRPSIVQHISVSAVLLVGILTVQSGFAQQKSDFAGDYAGIAGPYHVKLHIMVSSGGAVNASIDSPDLNLFALPCAEIGINGQTLSFTVPNVRGEWMGTLSGDHTTLSGIWKQGGSPIPLNFARSGAEKLTGNATPIETPSPASVHQEPTVAARSQHPACSSPTMGVNYWDGSAWKPMVMASHMGGDEGLSFRQGLKNPFNPVAGRTSIVTFKDPAATLTLDAKPSFCVMIPRNLDPTMILIGSLDVKKNHRQLETCNGMCASTAKRSMDDWMPEKRVQQVDIKRLSDTTVEITPKNPLSPGQYILGGPGVLVGYYDFGVVSDTVSQ